MKLLASSSLNGWNPQDKQHGYYNGYNYPVIWKILGLFSSPIRREIDHP